MRELGIGHSKAVVPAIENGVEAFEPHLTVDEAKRCVYLANVSDDEIDGVCFAAYRGVQRALRKKAKREDTSRTCV